MVARFRSTLTAKSWHLSPRSCDKVPPSASAWSEAVIGAAGTVESRHPGQEKVNLVPPLAPVSFRMPLVYVPSMATSCLLGYGKRLDQSIYSGYCTPFSLTLMIERDQTKNGVDLGGNLDPLLFPSEDAEIALLPGRCSNVAH